MSTNITGLGSFATLAPVGAARHRAAGADPCGVRGARERYEGALGMTRQELWLNRQTTNDRPPKEASSTERLNQ